MLVMKDCGVEPGDILFVVSNSNKTMVKIKQFGQSLTTPRSKHGHMEVISVFVCTGKNKYGVICHNFERQLTLSTSSFIRTLEERTIEELSVRLLNYCNKEFTADQLKEALEGGAQWMQHLAAQMKGNESSDELIEQFLAATHEDKDKLIQLIVTFWHASGQSEILPTVNSSLLVFKHTDSKIRQKFLDSYREQVKVTERLHEQGKYRASFWAVIKSFFSWSSQNQQDREKLTPDEETFCSSNLIQVLNQVDPNLVNRGKNVLPKSLEAGLREATKPKTKTATPQEELDDFEQLIAEQEQLLPPFKMAILPASGTALMSTLLAVIDKEINRIEHKFWANAADRQKAADLKKLLLPYRNPKFQSYPVNLQVDVSLELIATLLPTLQRKTGFWGSWISSTSYANVRAFARTQGIFDGDVREATEKLKTNPPNRVEEEEINEVPDSIDPSMIRQNYIFSDWSFSSWSADKRKLMLEHMTGLLTKGHFLYIWENGHLIKMTKDSLQSAINGEDFDDLLASKLKPATRAALIEHAKQQKIDTANIQFLDYRASKKLANDKESLESSLNQVAPLFALKIDEYHLSQTKQDIIDVEIANAGGDEIEKAELLAIKERIVVQKNAKHKTYQSGIDTRAFVSQPQQRNPIFKSVDLLTPTPSSKYYRSEVFPDLVINENPSSPFQYFELLGMNATEKLVDRRYQFRPNGVTQEVINKRKAESKQTLFKGEKTLSLTGEWQALPSLDPDERLLDIAIEGLKKNDFQIKYSKENHLYYIRLTDSSAEPKDVAVNLLLRMPKHYRAHPIFNTLAPSPEHQEVHRLLMKYLKFGKDDGALRDSIGVTVHNGHEYLREARKLEVASCRLRAIAFEEEMKRLHPEIPVSIIVNPDHCFIEMELDGLSHRYRLGGYRDTPSFVETIKENTLESFGYESQKHRFFAEISKSQPSDVPVEQEALSKKLS